MSAAEVAADEATVYRQQAAALGRLLEPHGVHVPPDGQLSLWADGGPQSLGG